MNIGQLDGQPLALQIFNGMTAESTCVNERWAKDQLFRCVCFAGGRHQTILDETVGPIFQSTSSVWRTTHRKTGCLRKFSHFNPRPPCGGRPNNSGRAFRATHFNPRPPCGGRQTIRAMRASGIYFNPRPPCGGRRSWRAMCRPLAGFQSTSSVRRTTTFAKVASTIGLFQSTSSVRRTTRDILRLIHPELYISIHVLRAEDDSRGP